MGWPLVWVCGLPVRGVDLWLDVNDPRVVAEVGRDVDRRGHANRRGSRCGRGPQLANTSKVADRDAGRPSFALPADASTPTVSDDGATRHRRTQLQNQVC
jgi:hypothetical protein